ncbi:MAG TPA: cardiolipin synthase, partial [Firmicutes bacterium]|nr:cardiolipin synthase [Bacillota bacterium]
MITFMINLFRIINVCLIIRLIFYKKKDPILLLAWSLFLLFIPVIGFIIYLLVERRPKPFKKIQELDEFERSLITTYHEEFDATITSNQYPLIKQYESLVRFNRNYNKCILTSYNELDLYVDAKEKYDQLFEDIKQAKHSIHVIYFIIRNDHSGLKFLELLTQKASEGVSVRLIYDSGGCLTTPKRIFNELKEAGGQVYNFHAPFLKLLWLNFNYRNHRKIVVIDGAIGYLGGMNIGDEYCSLNPKRKPWRDAHLRITGQSVALLQLRFLRDYLTTNKDKMEHRLVLEQLTHYFGPVQTNHFCSVQIVSDGPDTDTDDIKASFIKMIFSAKASIFIQTPYFIPDRNFLDALKTAAYSGIKVTVMIPTIADNHFVYRTTTSYVKELTEANITVYLYKGFLHSKIIVVDDQICTIGSTNIDNRSFKINYEINAFIYDDSFTTEVCKRIRNDMKNCKLVDDKYHNSKTIVVRGEESLYR